MLSQEGFEKGFDDESLVSILDSFESKEKILSVKSQKTMEKPRQITSEKDYHQS